mmetsp:Transcript_12840/g.30773  ORF Transcript_12840/g.30773 Transcript_12840/m.30773 type:complete len:92 (+) Transcript_12840:362-637(+)
MTWLKTEVLRWDATLLHAVAASAVVSVMLRMVLAVLLRCAEPEVRAITGECCAFMCVTVAMATYAHGRARGRRGDENGTAESMFFTALQCL